MWPGFGENSRVIEWIFGRCFGEDDAISTPIGFLPAPGAIDTTGLDVTSADLAALFEVDPAAWVAEAEAISEHYARFGSKLPAALAARLEQMKTAIAAA
jgi:phosphoenolpyruvate carboxykinase (GTP)